MKPFFKEIDLQKYKFNPKINDSGYLYRTFNVYAGHHNKEIITYYEHPVMLVGVHICIGDELGGYWNNTKEVLLQANYKGYCYRLGLDKYKSERSLSIRIHKFIKYIVDDTN